MAVKAEQRGSCLNLRRARGFIERFIGLIGRTDMAPDEVFLMERCAAIHTIGMQMPIDVVFLSAHGVVIKVCHALQPGRIRLCPGAAYTLELAAGTAATFSLRPGSTIVLGPSTLFVVPTKLEIKS